MFENREISERLKERLYAQVPFADNLKPALELACRQLELICPAVMGVNEKGFVGTLATLVPRGTWLMVLASPRKVFTIQMRSPPDSMTRARIIDDCVTEATALLGPPSPTEILLAVEFMVDKYGGKPGETTPPLERDVMVKFLGVLFGGTGPRDRADILEGVEHAIASSVCPLHVGLVGKGSTKGTSSGVWPLGLPFAPYADSLGI